MHQRSEKYVTEGSKYAHWIGLYLNSHLNWVLGPFVHGRLHNLKTSEVTFILVIAPLRIFAFRSTLLKIFRTEFYTMVVSSGCKITSPLRPFSLF